mgnify:CR=1 FL=1
MADTTSIDDLPTDPSSGNQNNLVIQKTEMNNGAKLKSYKIKCAKGNKSFIQQGKNPVCPKGYKLISRKAIN